jgi:hypothetical protein
MYVDVAAWETDAVDESSILPLGWETPDASAPQHGCFPPARVLRFPTDRSVGTLHLRAVEGDWREFGQAVGTISIPAGVEVLLCVHPNAGTSFLSRLHADDLQALDFVSAKLRDEDLQTIGGLVGLESLDLSWTAVGNAGIARLWELGQLKTLRVGHTRIGNAALAQIARMSSLRSLVLRGTSVTAAGLEHLRGNATLEDLDVAGVRLTDSAMDVIASLSGLRRLDLSGNPSPRLTARGIGRLADLPSLEWLNLAWTDFTDEAIAPLHRLLRMRELDISATRVTDEGVAQLAKLPIKRLVCVAATGVTNDAVEHLAGMASLCEVDLRDSCVDENGIRTFWALAPSCRVNGLTQACGVGEVNAGSSDSDEWFDGGDSEVLGGELLSDMLDRLDDVPSQMEVE